MIREHFSQIIHPSKINIIIIITIQAFQTDCPCGIWCRGLTTCPLHVGPRFGNEILK